MNRRNYQKELDALIQHFEEAGIRPSLLIHSCCAPCSSYVMEYLNRYFDLTMYFYNPNMDSREEYEKRASELSRLIECLNAACPEHPIRLVTEEYDPEAFEALAKGHETDSERGARCHLCYELRLRKTAEYMRDHNAAGKQKPYDFFATTLTLSPLKDAEVLNTIAEQLAGQYNTRCLPTDFKKRGGYQRSIELSSQYGLYRQNYCGCRFSRGRTAGPGHRDGDIAPAEPD